MVSVALSRYRNVLALPGVSGLMVLMFLARIPLTADSMVLTLHVVLGLHHGYGAAGLAGAMVTIGMAFGAPVLGRLVDSIGLRWMLVIATVGDGAFWLTAGQFSYSVLLVTAFVGGLLALPVMSIGRQAIAALVPEDQRRSAYSLDSISTEMSYMVGPALGVLVATRASTDVALVTVGVATVLSGIAIYLVNPRVRGDDEQRDPSIPPPPRRSWLRGSLISVLAINFGAVFVLAGVEVAVVAALRTSGQVGWTGVVTIAMCVASATGGVIYGVLHKAPGSAVLLGLMSLLLIPVVLAGGQWWVLSLVLAPTSMLCAPTLASTGEAVSRLAPAAVRGEAMGLHSSSLTLGAALGSPVIGTMVDRFGAPGGFFAASLGGVLISALVLVFGRRPPGITPAEPVDEASAVAG